jgi:putative membrane protein
MKISLLTITLSILSVCALHAAPAAGANTDSVDTISMQPGAESAKTSATATKANKDVTQTGARTAMSGATFVDTVAVDGATEIKAGKLAESRGQNSEVKKYGKMMVVQHGEAAAKLKAIAKKEGIALPKGLGAPQKEMLANLSSLKGKAFDKAYVADMMAAHEKAIAFFKDAAANCTNPALKAFAVETLPMLKMHLQKITAIHDIL